MHQKSLNELRSGLSAGEFSSRELSAHYLSRISSFNQSLNALISIDEEGALAAADAADKALKGGEGGALTGIPLIHKDIFCTEGLRTSCGSRMLDNFIAPYDATVVKKLKEAGTVLLGKANMDEFAMGSSNETSYYGAVANPWDTERVPGGSSIPVARSGNRRLFVASPVSNRPTAGFRIEP